MISLTIKTHSHDATTSVTTPIFFLDASYGSMATNASVHTGICISDFCCDISLSTVNLFFDAVIDAPWEWTFTGNWIEQKNAGHKQQSSDLWDLAKDLE